MSTRKPFVAYHAVVRNHGTLTEVARYTFPTRRAAEQAVRDLREIRCKQNRERVTVTLEK